MFLFFFFERENEAEGGIYWMKVAKLAISITKKSEDRKMLN